MRRLLRDNGLSIVLLVLFLLTWVGQTVTGMADHNDERREHRQPALALPQYLTSPHFLEATMENWESEFLQMFAFVILSVALYQRGSAESKDPDKKEDVDEDPRQHRARRGAPWPVRRGGGWLWLYSHSLSLAFLTLFCLSLWLHAVGGCGEYNEEEMVHGGTPLTVWQFMCSARFWFESFQNWQSEFLSIACMVIFSIWLREKGSPESKPVASPHSNTGR